MICSVFNDESLSLVPLNVIIIECCSTCNKDVNELSFSLSLNSSIILTTPLYKKNYQFGCYRRYNT